MELAFPHRVEYRDGTASIEEIIANLKAQKKLLEEGVRVLEAALPNLNVETIHIRVVQVAAGSLITELIILLYGAYQQEIESKVVGGIEEMFGTDIPEEYEALITLAALAVVYFVARYAYDAVRQKKQDRPASTHIEGDYNTVINVISDKINIPATLVDGAVHHAVSSRRRSLIKSVTNFLRPREDGRISPIEVRGVGALSPETLAEYPNDAELSEIDDSRNIDLPNVLLDIRAVDRDNNNTGWAAIVRGDKRFKKRLPMDLYPTIDAKDLAKRELVTGDVIVEGERKPDGSFKAKRIHLIAVKEEGDNEGSLESPPDAKPM